MYSALHITTIIVYIANANIWVFIV